MKHTFRFFIGICAIVAAASPARAGTILSIAPANVIAHLGDIGDSFDVDLTNTGASSLSVAGFQFEVTVASPNITLTNVDISTVSAAYVFAGNSLFGPNIAVSGPGQTIDAIDFTGDGSNATVGAGQTVGLGRVTFSVSNTATFGSFAVTFTGGSTANALSDAAGNNIVINTLTPGAIDVVPEPSSLALTIAGAAALAAAFRKRRAV
jgi:hypothetical protein